jgi:hypothetical protein
MLPVSAQEAPGAAGGGGASEFSQLPKGLSRSITEVEKDLTYGHGSGRIHKLADQFREEFSKPTPFCSADGVAPVPSFAELEGLEDTLLRNRDPRNAEAVDQLIEIIEHRERLRLAAGRTYCQGSWKGACRNAHGVNVDVALQYDVHEQFWEWRFYDPKFDPHTFRVVEPLVSEVEWLFVLSANANVRGNFAYQSKDQVERFHGLLTIDAYGSVTMSCELHRVYDKQEIRAWQ